MEGLTRERRLRRALIGVSMLAPSPCSRSPACCSLADVPPRPDGSPFTRGPNRCG